MPPPSSPRVTIVLINWNALDDTVECLESLQKLDYRDLSIIVIDHGSPDDQASTIQRQFPDIKVHAAGRNLGYTGGNNLGIELALAGGPDYILCLNNDTVVAPDLLLALVDAMEANPKAGVATPAIYQAHQPTRLAGLGCNFRFDRLLCGEPLSASPTTPLEQPFEVPYAEGCAMFLRRAMVEQIRGFDDQFFAYFEDADLCLRAKTKGWTSLAVPSARVWHKVAGKSSGENSPTACFYSARNSWLLVRKHVTLRQRQTFYRKYPRQVAVLLRDFVRSHCPHPDPAAARLERDRAAALFLGATAGWLRFTGRRDAQPWVGLERVFRSALGVFARLCLPFYSLVVYRNRIFGLRP